MTRYALAIAGGSLKRNAWSVTHGRQCQRKTIAGAKLGSEKSSSEESSSDKFGTRFRTGLHPHHPAITKTIAMEILGGPYYAVAGAGESHGPAVVATIMGCPAGLMVRRQDVQAFLDRRRPGGNKHGTPRNEKDKVVFLSGLYQNDPDQLFDDSTVTVSVDGASFQTDGYAAGYTTGEPIAAMVLSTSKKSGDYTQFTGPKGQVRPGHTDLVKHLLISGVIRYVHLLISSVIFAVFIFKISLA